MSGDVQPRKRKDKKRKRDDESSHGVHSTKMGSDDVHLHVQEDHGTGGHWCAKLLFFILLSVLVGLIGLIIMENRGLADLDTPLSESRYSNYFDGWVEERVDDHEHDAVEASIEEHEEHDEPFEEVEDHSEPTEEDADEADEHDDEDEEQEDEADKSENNNVDDDDDDEGDEEEEANLQESNEPQQNDDDDDEENEDQAAEEEDEDDAEDNIDEDEVTTKEQTDSQEVSPDNDEEEEDEDQMDENSVEIVDNDAQEAELLQEKAKAVDSKEADTEADDDDDDNNVEQNDNNDDNDAADTTQSWASAQIKNKAGGPQSYDEELDSFERELRAANEEMMRERLDLALNVYTQLNEKYRDNPKFVLRIAHALDEQAEKHRNNVLLTIAIETFQQFLNFGAAINDQDFRDVAKRCIERMRFLGHLKPSLKVHQQIMQRFSNEAWPGNDLAVTYLLMNREAEAKIILKETLRHWPDNGFALVHYGFVLKQLDNDYEQAVLYLGRGIAQESPGTQDSRFYLNYGDALQRLGRNEEALKVYDKATSLGLFPSRYQRSFYNEPNLRAKPIWSKNETTYEQYLVRLERNWQAIKAEGLNLISKKGYFQSESENLRQKGDWKQLELYVRGKQIKRNCQKAPITCALINDFPGARDCRRGQVKFSIIHPGTHVWPHCGPTNCRLRAHLGLVVPQGLRLRVAEKEYSWKEGEFIIFDDSFEHEVWHNGNSSRLVLIVDVWHPDLTKEQREQLTAI